MSNTIYQSRLVCAWVSWTKLGTARVFDAIPELQQSIADLFALSSSAQQKALIEELEIVAQELLSALGHGIDIRMDKASWSLVDRALLGEIAKCAGRQRIDRRRD